MIFKNSTITILTYENKLKETLLLLKNGFNYTKVEINDLINMIASYKLLCDYESLNDESKKKLNNYLKEKKNIKSAIAQYFNSISAIEILNDFSIMKKDKNSQLFLYFEAFVKFDSFKKLTSEQFINCIKNHYFHLDMILKSKKLVDYFPNEVSELMTEDPNAIKYLINCYDFVNDDNESKIKYYFPKQLNHIVDELINNYLKCQNININYLKALDTHKDNNQTYNISRKQRIRIKEIINTREEKLFSAGETFNYGFEITIDSKQNEPIKFYIIQNISKISFSSNYLKSDLSNKGIVGKFFFLCRLIDKQCRIASRYLPNNNESIVIKNIYPRKKNEYGSETFNYMLNFKNCIFETYYEFLLSQGIDYANILNDFINKFLSSKLPNLKFKSKIIHSYDDLSNCERIFNVIPYIFKQYKIYIEEGELTDELMEVSTDIFRVNEIPSLIKEKYYEVVKNSDLTKIFMILFSNQCMLNYIDETRNASNFYELLKKFSINKTDYKKKDIQYIDFLIKQDIVKEDANGILLLTNPLKLEILQDLYKNSFVTYRNLTLAEQKIIDDFKLLGYLKTTEKLFSSSEADYISYHLDNTRFSNALALRNRYEHSKGMHLTKEDNKKNYIIGLRLLTEIVAKIEDDINEYFL